MGEHNEFILGPVEFEMLDYAGSDVHQEAVNIGIELEEIIELRDRGLADESMDIDELKVSKVRKKITTSGSLGKHLGARGGRKSVQNTEKEHAEVE